MQDSSAAQLQFAYRTDTNVIGNAGNLLFALTRDSRGRDIHDISEKLTWEMIEDYPAGICRLVWVAPGSSQFEKSGRTRAQGLAKATAKHTLGMCLVVGGSGMWGATMRMVANTMMIVMPTDFPMHMSSTISDGVFWAHAQCGEHAQFERDAAAAALTVLSTEYRATS